MILYTVWYTLSSKMSILFVSCLLLFRFIKRQQQSHKTKHLPYKQGVIGSSPIVPTKCGPVVQLVRTLACHARGRRFEPVPGRHICLCSSVGRAGDWKSPCHWFDSDRRHHCGSSSSGRAPPCQGGGSEFEPRRPLQKKKTLKIRRLFQNGDIAKW